MGSTVVTAPPGATVSYVAYCYTTQAINGTTYYEYGGVDYQSKMMDGGTAKVVRCRAIIIPSTVVLRTPEVRNE